MRAHSKVSDSIAASGLSLWATSAKNGCFAISLSSRSARSPTVFIRQPHRPRSSTRCATVALKIFIAEDQEYVDKILPIADRLPDLKAIIVIDDFAMFGYTNSKIRRLRDLLEDVDRPSSTGSRKNYCAVAGRSGLYRLHVRHDRPPERRVGHPWQASCRHRYGGHAISDAA